jgi:hypothetical protein
MRAKEWLSKLKEPHRSLALKNWNGNDSSHINLPIALACAFDWEKSPQGRRYWNEIWNELNSELNKQDDVRQNQKEQQ